jgi:hypothetical protein
LVIACEQLWSQISNYLDGAISPDLRSAMDEHLRGCQSCRSVLDGTRNVVQLYGDERMVQVPLGFSSRLHRKLEANMPRQRGSAWGWMVAVAVAAMILASFQVGDTSASSRVHLRSMLAQPGAGLPADMRVVITAAGKTFHVPGCTFIHDKAHERTMTASEAIREGYVPCVRCLREYLSQAELKELEKSEPEVAADAD